MKRQLAIIGVALLSVGLVGCSGNTAPTAAPSSNVDGVKTAKAMVKAAEAPLTEFPAPGPAFDASKAAGKTVWFENYSASSSTTAIWSAALQDAFTRMGVKLIKFDGKAQIAEQGRGIEQAIAQKVDLIILSGIDPTTVSAQIAEVKKAGIPLIIGSTGRSIKSDNPNVDAFVSIDHTKVGNLLAAAAVANQGDKTNIAQITHTAITGTQVIVDGTKSELAKLCPSCKYSVQDLPFANISTLPQLAQGLIQKDPSLNYIMPVYDFETLNMLSAVQAASPTTQLASFNANPAVLKAMQTGNTIAFDIGAPNEWVGWADADQALRLLTGTKPVDDERIPIRVFTPEIAKTLDLTKPEATWYGDVDFKSEFLKLWGKK